MPKVLTIIQARLGSTRLPQKVLLPIAGKPLWQHVYDAAPEPKVLALPQEEYQEWDFHLLGTTTKRYYGPTLDVLRRFYGAWSAFGEGCRWILRLTADCPMIRREQIAGLFGGIPCVQSTLCDVGIEPNVLDGSIVTNRPRDIDGLDMELFTSTMLRFAHDNATDPDDREHVTPFMYRVGSVARVSVTGSPRIHIEGGKVSIDTLEDYNRVKALMEGTK